MADIEKNKLSDSQEVWNTSHIDSKIHDLDKKSADFVHHIESLADQKATQEVIAELENTEKSDVSLFIDQETSTSTDPVSTIKNKQHLSQQSLSSLIESKNPDSSPIANAGREKSYSIVQSQISSLPFGLDRFFADA